MLVEFCVRGHEDDPYSSSRISTLDLAIEGRAVHRRHAQGAQDHVIGGSGEALDRLLAVRGLVSHVAYPHHHAHDGLAERCITFDHQDPWLFVAVYMGIAGGSAVPCRVFFNGLTACAAD